MQNKKLSILITILSLAITTSAGNLSTAITFYEDCEDSKSPYPGVKISPSIAIIDQGKFGKCFRMERRTFNSLHNGDFKSRISDSWLYRSNASWHQDGGIDNSSCLEINRGEVVIPVLELKKNSANAFSFYARSNEKSSISVIWTADGKEQTLADNLVLGKSFKRIEVPFYSSGDSGSLHLKVTGHCIIDNAQIDQGVNFFNSFTPPLRRRSVDSISIPSGKRFFNAARGAVSAWVNIPWLNDKNTVSDSICCLFAVRNAKKKIKKWGDHIVMVMNCIPRNRPDMSQKKGSLYFFTIDASNRSCKVSEQLVRLPDVMKSNWKHLVYNWELKPDNTMRISMWLDGEKVTETSKPFGPLKKAEFINIGYVDGAYLNGLIDDFAIFNRPLAEKEIKTIFKSQTAIAQLLQEKK